MKKIVLVIFMVVLGFFSMSRMVTTSWSEQGAHQIRTNQENLIQVTRTVQIKGNSILVELKLSVEEQSGSLPNGVIIREHLPAESLLLSSSPPVDSYDTKAAVIKWLLIGEEIYSRTLTYEFQTVLSMDEMKLEGTCLYKLEGKRISKAIENIY